MVSPSGEEPSLGIEQTLGQFALVSYLPDPLAHFLDVLRLELTPACKPRAHVTVLPPRPLHSDVKQIVEQLATDTRDIAPFRVETGDIDIFDKSNVVYLGLAAGVEQLRALYFRLNWGCLLYKENFPYQPHITMAQNISAEDAPRLAAIARERWARYKGPRTFEVSGLSLVQHVAPMIWADVAFLPLNVAASADHLPACEPVNG